MLAGSIMIINLDLTIVNLDLPRIFHELHAALPQMQWVMSGYLFHRDSYPRTSIARPWLR